MDKGEIDTSHLKGTLDDQEIIIVSVLINTAVYVTSSNQGVKKLESVEKIMVKKSDISYLPVKESTKPNSKPRPNPAASA